jgi:hypothetical protein
MKIKPVKNSQKPNYPTIELYVNHPDLLTKNVPENWLKNTYVASSLAAFVLLGSPNNKLFATNVNTEFVNQINPDKKENIKEELKDSIKIAPIFAHGDGSGATGCVVMSPPVFISEEEARKLIFDRLKEEGFLFDTTETSYIKIIARPIANSCFHVNDSLDENLAEFYLKTDGYNKKYDLNIVYVSVSDFEKFHSYSDCVSSVQGYRTKKAAEIIRQELISSGKTNAVVFYDPIPSIEYEESETWQKSETNASEEAKKQLLDQVEDFIKWLKLENIKSE